MSYYTEEMKFLINSFYVSVQNKGLLTFHRWLRHKTIFLDVTKQELWNLVILNQ